MKLLLLIFPILLFAGCLLFDDGKVDCPRRPLTEKEKIYFDSLKTVWNLDTIVVNRVDFGKCDENGLYSITFRYCSKAFISQTDSIEKWSERIVCDLHTKVLSTKVACVTNDYFITFKGRKKVVNKTKDIQLDLTPSATLTYEKENIERFTGVKYYGSYWGKEFKRKDGVPATDTLKFDYGGINNGEDPLL